MRFSFADSLQLHARVNTLLPLRPLPLRPVEMREFSRFSAVAGQSQQIVASAACAYDSLLLRARVNKLLPLRPEQMRAFSRFFAIASQS